MPIAWEQIEPQEGRFDFSFLDTLLGQAREQDVRLVLLWFATWKNNGPNYAPEWVKLDNRRFPRLVTADGKVLNSMSPHQRSYEGQLLRTRLRLRSSLVQARAALTYEGASVFHGVPPAAWPARLTRRFWRGPRAS